MKIERTTTAGKPMPIRKLHIQLTIQESIEAAGLASCVKNSELIIQGIGPSRCVKDKNLTKQLLVLIKLKQIL